MEERKFPLEINIKYRDQRAFNISSLVQILSLNSEANKYYYNNIKSDLYWNAKVISVQYGFTPQFEPNLIIWNTMFCFIAVDEVLWLQVEEVKIQFGHSSIKNIQISCPYVKFRDFDQITIRGISEWKSQPPKFVEAVLKTQKSLKENDYFVMFDSTLSINNESEIFSVRYSK